MCLAATLGTRVGLSFPFRERFFSFHHWNELSFHIGIPALDTTISRLLVVVELRSFWERVLQLNNLIAFLTLDGGGVVGLFHGIVVITVTTEVNVWVFIF